MLAYYQNKKVYLVKDGTKNGFMQIFWLNLEDAKQARSVYKLIVALTNKEKKCYVFQRQLNSNNMALCFTII